jgi:hypothetical protein
MEHEKRSSREETNTGGVYSERKKMKRECKHTS